MSDPAQTTACLLESSFRAALAPVLQISVRVQNDPLPTSQDASKLPAIIVSARELEDYEGVKYQGRYARRCAIAFDCRVEGDGEASEVAVKHLAATVTAAIRSSSPSGWIHLELLPREDTRVNAEGTRSIKLNYEARALAAAA